MTTPLSALTLPCMGDTGTSLTVLARTGAGKSGLICTLAEISPGGQHAGTAGAGGELWFVIGGSAGSTWTARQDLHWYPTGVCGSRQAPPTG